MYEGDRKAGVACGKGIFKSQDGTVYEGEFRNDVRDGKGKFVDKQGNVYVGDYEKGKRHGVGSITFRGVGTVTLRFSDGEVTEALDFKFDPESEWARKEF